jgi:hypothetical protein
LKKRFELTAPNKDPLRVLEAVKNEIRKYIKREKRKTLPAGMDMWNINCKFSKDDEEPQEIVFQDIIKCLDEAAALNSKSVYLELISSAVKREPKVIENEDEVISEVIENENREEPII